MNVSIDHMIKKEYFESHITSKVPHHINKGVFSTETEYQKEYPGKVDEPPSNLKVPESINFGDNRYFDQAHKEHFPGYHPNGKGVDEKETHTHGLKMKIKEEGKYGHLFKGKEEPTNKYVRDANILKEGLEQRPYQWVRGVNNKSNLPFDKNTTNKLHYRGHSQDFANKQNERFDNLKNPKGIKVKGDTTYQEKHNNSKSPDAWKVSTLEHNINQKYGKSTEKVWRNPDWKSKTQYNRDYTPNAERNSSPHVGRDERMRNLLEQYHNGYFYK